MKQLIAIVVLLIARASWADISESGNMTLGGNAIIGGTITVQGNAFSVGGTTFSVAGGSVTLGGQLNLASPGLKFSDGTTQATAATSQSASSSGFITNNVYSTTNTSLKECVTGSSRTFTTTTGIAECSLDANITNTVSTNGHYIGLWCQGAWVAQTQTSPNNNAMYITAPGANYQSNASFVRQAAGLGTGSKTCCFAIAGDSGTTKLSMNTGTQFICREAR